MKKALALFAACIMALGLFSACAKNGEGEKDPAHPPRETEAAATPAPAAPPDPALGESFTLDLSCTKLPACWDPQTAHTGLENFIVSLTVSPLVKAQPVDTETGEFRWTYELAESVRDATPERAAELERFGIKAPKNAEGYVYEIALDPEARWQNGERITAADFVYSMKALLDPAAKRPLGADFVTGAAAVAGGYEYMTRREEAEFIPVCEKYPSCGAAEEAGEELFIDAWALCGAEGFKDGCGNACPRWLSVSDGTRYYAKASVAGEYITGERARQAHSEALEPGGEAEGCLAFKRTVKAPSFEESVGFFAEDGKLVYVCAAPASLDEMMLLLSKPWLVYPRYHAAEGYAGSPLTTMSCGAYQLDSVEDGVMTFTRNPRYTGWRTAEDGSMLAFTEETVNGEHITRYQTTRVLVREMRYAAAEQELLAGKLTAWEPEGADIKAYSGTRGFTSAPTDETNCIFFNIDPDALRMTDLLRGNTNSAVLSSHSFRRAVSLAVDRSALAQELGGSVCLGLINSAVLLDPMGDASADYRGTETAMQAVCELYGAAYGEDTPYIGAKEAYAALTGYNVSRAAALMREACTELTEAGLYTEGEPVKIRVACERRSKDTLRAMELINRYVNSAAHECGFGRITFEVAAVGRREQEAVSSGEYAMGYAPLKTDALDLFGSLTALCDPTLYGQSGGGFDPYSETLALTVQGKKYSLPFAEWSRSLSGAGRFSGEPAGVRLQILASLEEALLGSFRVIPLTQRNEYLLMNAKARFLTERPSPFCGRGGIEFIAYNYSDPEWEEYTAAAYGPVYK